MKTVTYMFVILFYPLWCYSHGYPEVDSQLMSLIKSQRYNVYSEPKHFGTECETNNDCEEFFEGSKCLNSQCRCPDSWLLSRDRTRCLKSANEYGAPCEEDIQCSERLLTGGVCEDNACKCKEGYHYLKGKCWKSQQLQQKCFKNEQCFSSYDYRGQECKNKICVCQSGYYDRFNSSCRKIRNPGESCNVDTDCLEGSTCEKMKCTGTTQVENVTKPSPRDSKVVLPENGSSCPPGRFLLDGKCVLELGMNCSSNSDCSHIAKASCMNNICSCEPVLAVSNDNRRKCLPVARGKVADISKSTCKENPQCSIFGENSYCNSKKCACKNGTYWDIENQICWTVKRLRETCTSSKDCNPVETHAECSSSTKVCTCQKGYRAKESSCLPEAKEVGGYCDTNEDCLLDNSLCDVSNKTCICQDSHYVDKGQCVPGLGAACITQDQCSHLKNSQCIQGNSAQKICDCKENHVKADDLKYCLPIAKYGESCHETFQCRLNLGALSICDNGTCACNQTAHLYKEQCHRSRSIGQSCTKKQECFLNGDTESAICLNGYCSCQYNYALDAGNCVKTNLAAALQQQSILTSICVTVLTLWLMP